MTAHDDETLKGSLGTPGRRSEGVAGPSREVSKRDPMTSGAGSAGRENEELRWARTLPVMTPPAREYITLPGRLKKRLDEMDRRIATFPQRRWM